MFQVDAKVCSPTSKMDIEKQKKYFIYSTNQLGNSGALKKLSICITKVELQPLDKSMGSIESNVTMKRN